MKPPCHNRFAVLAPLVFGVAVSACAQATPSLHASALDLVLGVSGDEMAVEIEIANRSNSGVDVVLPLTLSPSSRVGGIEYVVHDASGERKDLCAFVSPSVSPKEVELPANSNYKTQETIEYFGDLFCLADGTYTLKAIFHNKSGDRNITPSPVSNEIEIKVFGRKP